MLYSALFALAYYDLLRVGELTAGEHPIRAKDIHVAHNKNKILIILYTSKTHGKESRPQEIKISSVTEDQDTQYELVRKYNRFFCPFQLLRKYMVARGEYDVLDEQLFIFSDCQPVRPSHANRVLNKVLKKLNQDDSLYSFHSFRVGRASDLFNKFNYSISRIKQIGRWKLSAVYRYLWGISN